MFPVEIFEEQKNKDRLLEIAKYQLCDNCLGRQYGMLGHGMTNEERGQILRGVIRSKEPKVCWLCNNFFADNIYKLADAIVKKLSTVEFTTFLIGSVVSDEMGNRQEELWEKCGIDYVEPIKAEINRELGKLVEKKIGKFDLKNPDITAVADLKKNETKLQIRSLYVSGGYEKLVRTIPQSKWTCLKCGGKGCVICKGEGKLYPTSVQEIIDKPLLKATGSKKSKFSAAGREDIDARCLDWRPFVIELLKPLRRMVDLRKLEKQINKSKKVQVKGLEFSNKSTVRNLKDQRHDKTYLAEVEFNKVIDRKLLKGIRLLKGEQIIQKTPLRVVHRRADKFRKRTVKNITWKMLASKRIQLKITGEAGLYIKELISGDEGRTNPNISAMLGNKVKKIRLDVIKIQ